MTTYSILTYLTLHLAAISTSPLTLHSNEVSTSLEEDRGFCIPFIDVMGDIECVDDDEKFCFVNQGCPYPRIPDSPEDINTFFLLYTVTPDNPSPTTGQKFFPSSDFNEAIRDFDASLPLIFIIHGWSENIERDWMTNMTEALAKSYTQRNQSVNIVLVDWRDGAAIGSNLLTKAYSYIKASSNTRMVGKQIAILINELEHHFDVDIRKTTHVIGYSLGGQVAGNTGMYFNEIVTKRTVQGCPKINRITGIDVAGPFFEDTDASLRLDPTDACYVEAIHTHGFLKGIKRTVGHIDFYPNGGMQQPGCSEEGQIDEATSVWDIISAYTSAFQSSCSHIRGPKLYIESINNDIQAFGYPCRTFEDFEAGLCQSGKKKFGFDWNPEDTVEAYRFFLNTRDEPPYLG